MRIGRGPAGAVRVRMSRGRAGRRQRAEAPEQIAPVEHQSRSLAFQRVEARNSDITDEPIQNRIAVSKS